LSPCGLSAAGLSACLLLRAACSCLCKKRAWPEGLSFVPHYSLTPTSLPPKENSDAKGSASLRHPHFQSANFANSTFATPLTPNILLPRYFTISISGHISIPSSIVRYQSYPAASFCPCLAVSKRGIHRNLAPQSDPESRQRTTHFSTLALHHRGHPSTALNHISAKPEELYH
jgi:hypothetical protein